MYLVIENGMSYRSAINKSSEWEVAVQIAVAKQMKRLKYCSIVLADHKRTYNTLKGEKIPYFHYTENVQENSI